MKKAGIVPHGKDEGREKEKRPDYPAFCSDAGLFFLHTELFLQIVDIGTTMLEVLVIHDANLQIDVSFDAVDDQLLQRIFHA
jgi:hypothetical protein